MNQKAFALSALAVMSLTASAEPEKSKYPAVYPFIPEATTKIYGDVKKVTEDPGFIRNFNDIISQKLSVRTTSDKPWSASYWPLSKGTIADAYENDGFSYFMDINWLTWENNYKNSIKRRVNKLSKVDEMSDKELSELAPSEKYDLLLGDKSFGLTTKLWDYMNKWGSQKENVFIKKDGLIIAGEDTLDLAYEYLKKYDYKDLADAFARSPNLKVTLSAQKALELVTQGKYDDPAAAFAEALDWAKEEETNYVLVKKNSRIAVWEGICNGWATSAGLVPRPRRAVSFRLPNGKNLKFYPEDIKGIISLYYVNSVIQDPAKIGFNGLPYTQGTVQAGQRCNLANPKIDAWGRLYDHKVDPTSVSGTLEARCSGVHPATWHLGLVNLIGKQNRSFVVERKVGAAVDNHPMYGYRFKYFNPNSGRFESDVNRAIEQIDRGDQFRQFRNPKARYIVGVETTVTYLNYHKPKREETDSEKDDSEVDHTMMYDLELDGDFNIVGGQWRASRVGLMPDGQIARSKLNHNQPNFFWTITRDYKKTGFFSDDLNASPWKDKRLAPPADWLGVAKGIYHGNTYENLISLENADTCQVKHKKTGKTRTVFCELETNKPLPLINVVNALVELSK